MSMFKKRFDTPINSFWHQKFGPTIGGIMVFILEVLQIVIISAAIIIPIRYFLIQPFYVEGASMQPNFYDQDYLIVDELSYNFHEPKRGEIVVFRYPRDPRQFFIKRVVGLPGETIEINNGQIIIYNNQHPNGQKVKEDYIKTDYTQGKVKTTLGIDEFFLMGDNRDESMDSRSFGPVKADSLIGRVWVRGFPLSRITTFDLPKYNF